MIPATAHFIWLGPSFPWVQGLAVRSAAMRGEFDRVVLHHSHDLSATVGWRVVTNTANVQCRLIDPVDLLRLDWHGSNSLVKLYKRLKAPSARANLLRVALLAREGGVYLDMDTVTLRSMKPLLHTGVFCGSEHIAVPGHVAQSGHPLVRFKALRQRAVRDVYRRLPNGWRYFRNIENSYYRAANNAVLGSAPGHRFLFRVLKGMITMPRERQLTRYALGTHLLQQVIADYDGGDLTVHPPELFYPFPPEISEHWFRFSREVCLNEAVTPQTCLVHWYASVRTANIVPKIEPEYVRQHANQQLFSALVLPFL